MYDDEDENDDKIKTAARGVTVLGCDPARADTPDGDPVAVVTFGCLGDIEPNLIPLPQVKELVRELLAVLHHFDDASAAPALKAIWPGEYEHL